MPENETDSRNRYKDRESFSPYSGRARKRLQDESELDNGRGSKARKHDERQRYRSRSGDHEKQRRSFSPERRLYSRPSGRHNSRKHQGEPDRQRERSPKPLKRSSAPLPSQSDAFANDDLAVVKRSPQPDKQKPNFSNTGCLAAESNKVQAGGGQTIILKYHEPPEARKPALRDAWRMYVFKGDEIVDTIELAERSCWLVGRESAVVDCLLENPSCSKQHAVIQFRYLEKRNEYGDKKGMVRPYILDLESANGTTLNGEEIPAGRYLELRDKDVLKFGHSSREYVVQLPPAG